MADTKATAADTKKKEDKPSSKSSSKKDGEAEKKKSGDDKTKKTGGDNKVPSKPADKKGSSDAAKKKEIPVVAPSQHFDLKQYAGRYVGHTKVRNDVIRCCDSM
jgi:hypothetical protein